MDSAEVKEEAVDVGDGGFDDMKMSSDAQTYVLQQQQLPYTTPSKVRPADENNETEEIPPKRPRRASAIKALEHMGSEEEDDPDYDGDNYTKAESDDSEKDEDDDEDETYREGPSTSMDDQPGTSGMTKGSTETPSKLKKRVKDEDPDYQSFKCEKKINEYACKACEESSSKQISDHNIKYLNRFPLQCPECLNIYLFRCEYRSHYRHAHENDSSNIASHEEKVKRVRNKFSKLQTDKGYECVQCAKFFATRQSYRTHQRKQHDNERFVCDLCGKVLTEIASLRNHRRTHSGEKPFMCEDCGKSFSSKKLLRTHERVHSGEKPNKCPTCDKRFAQRAALNTHMKYHSGVRPHVCSICQKGFITRTLLKNHLKKHGVSVNFSSDEK